MDQESQEWIERQKQNEQAQGSELSGGLDRIIGDPSFTPIWEPLIKAIGEEKCKVWKFMASYTLASGVVIHTYKHSDSRVYFNISGDGRFWDYLLGGYRVIKAA